MHKNNYLLLKKFKNTESAKKEIEKEGWCFIFAQRKLQTR